jgi:hypothetical protein
MRPNGTRVWGLKLPEVERGRQQVRTALQVKPDKLTRTQKKKEEQIIKKKKGKNA